VAESLANCVLEAVHNCFGEGRKPAFFNRRFWQKPGNPEESAYFGCFEKTHIYKDLRRKSVNRKILRDCSKKAKKRMTKLNV